jgi:flagellar motor protein MotB
MTTSCEARTLTVPAAASFAGDSAVLKGGSELALTPIAEALRRCPEGAAVSVIGHAADPTPNVVDAQDLSTARAHAVRIRLIELGAPPLVFTEVRGVGDTQPKVENWVNGQFSEPLAALNRRVDVIIQPVR